MAHFARLLTVALVCLCGFGGVARAQPPAGAPGLKHPRWTHAFDLRARKSTEPTFTDKTKAFGVEVFRDDYNGNGVYLDAVGSLAVLPHFKNVAAPLPGPKEPEWLHGLDLKCRSAGEKEFTRDTRVYSIEVFRDANNGNLIYVMETGAIAVVAGPAEAGAAPPKARAPEWLHGLDLKVRKAGEHDFTPKTTAYSLEVFRDANNANLVYLAETGNLAVVPGNPKLPAPTAPLRQPRWTHALDLHCRQAGEADFTPKTRVFSVEVFRDENTAATVYLADGGTLAAAAAE